MVLSEAACMASSPGRTRGMEFWTSREVASMVDGGNKP